MWTADLSAVPWRLSPGGDRDEERRSRLLGLSVHVKSCTQGQKREF